MNTFTAHGLLANRSDRSIFDADVSIQTSHGSADAWPATVTALASLSGMLDDAQSEADLDEAIRHGLSLWSGGIIDEATVTAEAGDVIHDLMAECETYATN